jgi:cytochrome b6-f complex subunit 5
LKELDIKLTLWERNNHGWGDITARQGLNSGRMRLDKYFKSELRRIAVVEPLLLGIVLGLVPITLAGLFVAAYLQYKRGSQLNLD